jgi:alkylation response protein AidB-like acyl-CoA dehydrogenase
MGLNALQVATIQFDDVKLNADTLLGDKAFDLQRFINLSRIGICALAVGTCQAVLDYVKEYCNERIAFGEPITNRQSVAFMIADIAIELEAMRLMTWRAASRAEQGLDFHEQAYLAKVFCAEHAMKIGTDGVQLLGGHGFCCEHPVEMWYRNLRAITLLEGAACV